MTIRSENGKTVLWWGRFDPEYSRNRILRQFLFDLGYTLYDFRPRISWLGTVEAAVARLPVPDAIWVPAFRQSDFNSARIYADKHNIPLIFDPLISAWDKAVFERKKYSEESWRSKRLLYREQQMFSRADLVLADTELHAQFFIDDLLAAANRTTVIPVGAEEKLFPQQPFLQHEPPSEVLFYGSFIHLQGPEIIAEAAALVPEARWTMLGNGPLRSICEEKSSLYSHINFEDWCPYDRLAERIGQADLLLGIFGSSSKAGRVIPNKAYQALSCGRPLITQESTAYPAELRAAQDSGITFIEPGNPQALAGAVREMIKEPQMLPERGRQARASYEAWFSEAKICDALQSALVTCLK